MTIRQLMINKQVISQNDLLFMLSIAPEMELLLEKKATDSNVISFIDVVQDKAVSLLGDGNQVSREAQKFDDVVAKISEI